MDTEDLLKKARHFMVAESGPIPGWPPNVRPVTLEGLFLVGIDPLTRDLYFDGQKVVTERRLANREWWLALGAVGSAAVVAFVELARAITDVYWWAYQ